MTVQHLKKAMGERLKNSRKSAQGWGKMGEEFYGESILRLTIFPIFPHFSPLAPPKDNTLSSLRVYFASRFGGRSPTRTAVCFVSVIAAWRK